MSRYRAYAPHDSFIRPAFAVAAPALVIVVLLGFEVIFEITGIINYQLLDTSLEYPESTPFGTITGFATFGITLALFHGLAKLIHKRGIGSMLGPLGQVWQDGRKTLLAVFGLLLALEAIMPAYHSDDIIQTRNFFAWALMLPIGCAAILIQCATEEVVYRGYLQQQVAVLTRGPISYLLVPSVIFGFAHYGNGWGMSDGVLYAIWATMLGLACADLTARTGSLGAAIGLHTANNIYVTVLFAEQGQPGSGLALRLAEPVNWAAFDYSSDALFSVSSAIEILFSALSILLMWLTARIAIAR